ARTNTVAIAKKKATEPDSAAAAAGESAREARARRRRRAAIRERGHGNEFMDLQPDPPVDAAPESSPTASDRGAGPLGFSGVRDKATAMRTTGLTTLGEAGLGGGPSAPMLPSTWEPDRKD
ncbi:hypothetical protein ABFW09_32480, partial [Mycolicibacterium fortuitum]